MKRSGFISILGFSFLLFPRTAEAFSNSYQCTAEAETTVGYAPASMRVETEAGKVKNSYSVRLAGVISGATVLQAQQVVPMVKVAATRNVIWFSEKASAGTVIVSTLFEKDNIRPVTLINTKSYDFSGAVSFTAFYTCHSN
jgi:hypothetical protein